MTTIILSTNSDGVARAYIIPEGDLTLEMDVDRDEFKPWENYGLPSYRLPMVAPPRRLVINDLGEYTMLQSVGDGMEDDTSTTIEAAMKLVTDRLDTIRHEGRQSRRRTAATNLLESQGVKPKKAAKIAAALLDTVDGVQ